MASDLHNASQATSHLANRSLDVSGPLYQRGLWMILTNVLDWKMCDDIKYFIWNWNHICLSVLSFSQNKSWIHRGNVRHMVHRWSKWCLNQHYSMQPDLGKFVGIITGKSNSVGFLKNPHKAVSHLNTKLCMSCYKIICLGKNTIIKVPQVNYTNFLPELYVCLFGLKTKNVQCQQTYHTAIFSVGFYSV